jgi:hypothetical protein
MLDKVMSANFKTVTPIVIFLMELNAKITNIKQVPMSVSVRYTIYTI